MQKLVAERETGFGAGVLLIARSTKRALWIKRSDQGDYPGYWCCPGGGIEDNETIEQGVRREVAEEIGYTGPYTLIHMARITYPDFVYHNHVAWVPEEFEPELNEEHTDFVWATTPPEPTHPGLLQALKEFTARHK